MVRGHGVVGLSRGGGERWRARWRRLAAPGRLQHELALPAAGSGRHAGPVPPDAADHRPLRHRPARHTDDALFSHGLGHRAPGHGHALTGELGVDPVRAVGAVRRGVDRFEAGDERPAGPRPGFGAGSAVAVPVEGRRLGHAYDGAQVGDLVIGLLSVDEPVSVHPRFSFTQKATHPGPSPSATKLAVGGRVDTSSRARCSTPSFRMSSLMIHSRFSACNCSSSARSATSSSSSLFSAVLVGHPLRECSRPLVNCFP